MSNNDSKSNFIEWVLEGEAFDTDVDDFVETWHNSNSSLTLAQFLGFSDEEYALWVEQPESLRSILFCRKNEIDLAGHSEWQEAHRLAARSQGLGDPEKLLKWLKETGRAPLMLPEEKIARRFSQQRKLNPPVDTEKLVKEFALLEEDQLPDGYDAVFLDKSSKHPKPRVIISQGLPPARRVFTLGHELGHILIPWHNGTHFCHIGAEAKLIDNLVKKIESEANRFAAELLMPAGWVESLIQSDIPIGQLVEAVKTANVSYQAASIRLSQLLPSGHAFVEINSDNIIQRVQSTTGTRVYLPNENTVLIKKDMDHFADDSASFSSGSSKIIWWRFAKKLTAPETKTIGGSASDLLRQIANEFSQDEVEVKSKMQSINGVIGAANGEFKRTYDGDLFTILKQRFAHRKELTKIVGHPSFDAFLQKRIEEIHIRKNGSPF